MGEILGIFWLEALWEFFLIHMANHNLFNRGQEHKCQVLLAPFRN